MRTPIRKIRLTQGYVAIVDAADAELVSPYKWRVAVIDGKPYAVASLKAPRGKVIYMQRLISGAAPGCKVRFNNRNTLDNRRKNLFATPPQDVQGGAQ